MRVIFGKDDAIYFPVDPKAMNIYGGSTRYTHGVMDGCYSKHGFAFERRYEGMPYGKVVDNQLPPSGPIAKPFLSSLKFLLITPTGDLWNLLLTQRDDEPYWSTGSEYIHRFPGSWWVSSDEGGLGDHDWSTFLAFLHTDPSDEKIFKTIVKFFDATIYTKFSISEIVKTINEKYPSEKD